MKDSLSPKRTKVETEENLIPRRGNTRLVLPVCGPPPPILDAFIAEWLVPSLVEEFLRERSTEKNISVNSGFPEKPRISS